MHFTVLMTKTNDAHATNVATIAPRRIMAVSVAIGIVIGTETTDDAMKTGSAIMMKSAAQAVVIKCHDWRYAIAFAL